MTVDKARICYSVNRLVLSHITQMYWNNAHIHGVRLATRLNDVTPEHTLAKPADSLDYTRVLNKYIVNNFNGNNNSLDVNFQILLNDMTDDVHMSCLAVACTRIKIIRWSGRCLRLKREFSWSKIIINLRI